MDEQRYYTPKLEDLRVGYCYELGLGSTVDGDGELTEEWQFSTIHEEDKFWIKG